MMMDDDGDDEHAHPIRLLWRLNEKKKAKAITMLPGSYEVLIKMAILGC